MRVRIETERTSLAPQILDAIATRMEQLNLPYQDILHARIALVPPEPHLPGCYEARVTLVLDGKTLHATRGGPSPTSAIDAALEAIAWSLHGFRTRQFLVVN